MAKDSVVSVRIPKKLKEELKRYGVDVPRVVRKALTTEVKKAKARELEKRSAKIRPILNKIPFEEVLDIIREERETR